jgi:hypothetical protein
VGSLSHQVNSFHETTSLRIILGIIHLSAKNIRELKRTSRR